jgi:phosphate-selective porin OprO/OprP
MKRLRKCLLVALAAVSWLPNAAGAEEPTETQVLLRDVLERVDLLEVENQELRREIRQRSGVGPNSAAPGPFASAPIQPDVAWPTSTGDPPQAPAASVFDEVPAPAAPANRFNGATQWQSPPGAAPSGRRELHWKPPASEYPTVTVNGAFQADVGWFHQDDVSLQQFGRIQDGADFRRFRISAKGSVTETVNYLTQVDFGSFGRPTFTDVWVEQTRVPLLGNVRIGQWKHPFSLEVVSSYRYTTFMERSLLFQPLTPFRHIGVGFYDSAEDLSGTWAASVFRSGQDQFGGSLSTDGGWGTAERLTWLPAWEDDGRSYLHLGVGHFFNSPPHDRVNFRTIPEFFIGANANGLVGTSGQPVPGGHDGTPFFVETGNLDVTGYNVLGTELLWVLGPLSVQSEGMVCFVDQGQARPSAVLAGAYAQVGWFLTGEHRPYDRKSGAIDRVVPDRNFWFCRGCGSAAGWGAWELAARWSWLDLDDNNIRGGEITDATVGVNWFWNPYTKIVFNYIRGMPEGRGFPRSSTDMFGLRAQIDF